MEPSIPVRHVHLGTPFIDGRRTITIRRARFPRKCSCDIAGHIIPAGDLHASVLDHRSGERQHWHRDHLQHHWKLIVLDEHSQEVARFGC